MIAVEVFGRPVASFDPKFDTIVRSRRGGCAHASPSTIAARAATAGSGSSCRSAATCRRSPLRETEAAPDAGDPARPRPDRARRALPAPAALQAHARERAGPLRRGDPHRPGDRRGLRRPRPAWLNLATGWHHEPAIAAEHAAEALRHALELDPGHAVRARPARRDPEPVRARLGRRRAELPARAGARAGAGVRALRLRLAPADARAPRSAESELTAGAAARSAVRQLARPPGEPLHRPRPLRRRPAEIESMRDLAPESLAANGLSAVVSLASGDPEAAVAEYAQLCEHLPDSPGCLACLAGAHAAPAGSPSPTASSPSCTVASASGSSRPTRSPSSRRSRPRRRRLRPARARRRRTRPERPAHPARRQLRQPARRSALAGAAARVRGETPRRRARAAAERMTAEPSLRPPAAARAFWWACAARRAADRLRRGRRRLSDGDAAIRCATWRCSRSGRCSRRSSFAASCSRRWPAPSSAGWTRERRLAADARQRRHQRALRRVPSLAPSARGGARRVPGLAESTARRAS